jgi:hypothetical protein
VPRALSTERLRPAFIPPIMREAHRVLKDGGLCVHAVACNDHYAFFHESISFVNFVQFRRKGMTAMEQQAELSQSSAGC